MKKRGMVIKGTVFGMGKDFAELRNSEEYLPAPLISLFLSLIEEDIIDKNSRKGGRINSRINGITNDLHNLSVIIKMMKETLEEREDNGTKFLYFSVLFESYITTIRSLLDLLVPLIKYIVTEKQRGQLPEKESINKLINWLDNPNNRGKINQKLEKTILKYEEDIKNIKNIRDYIIHKGGEPSIFKHEGSYKFSVQKGKGPRACNLAENLLEIEGEQYPVFPYLRYITITILNLRQELMGVLVELLGEKRNEKIKIKIHALTGICMPVFKNFLLENGDFFR